MGPDIPASPPPAPPPSMTDQAVLDARRRERQRAMQLGVKSTMYTGPQGVQGNPTLGTPTLLGGNQ